jgi:hypothetical protein
MPLPSADLRARVVGFGNLLAAKRTACTNEESTKLFLILPFLAVLGYDPLNPYEVYPEHAATFDPTVANKVDFAVLRDGVPVIAIECKRAGVDLANYRGQLRRYFNALRPVKLGILTNGIVWEFFVDSDDENLMDEEPFLTLDLGVIAGVGIGDEMLNAVASVTKALYEPAAIAEMAHVLLVQKRLRSAFAQELRAPSIDFCRSLLKKIGERNLQERTIRGRYEPMVKSAIVDVVQRQATQRPRAANQEPDAASLSDPRVVTTERELEIFAYARHRLAYLVSEERHYRAIQQMEYKDYIGKLVVFLEFKQKGWLFDYIEGSDGCDKFIFPDPFGKIVTRNLLDIDAPLKAVFEMRVLELTGERAFQELAETA